MNVATGLTVTHNAAVDLPSGDRVTLRVRAVNGAGIRDSDTIELQGMYAWCV